MLACFLFRTKAVGRLELPIFQGRVLVLFPLSYTTRFLTNLAGSSFTSIIIYTDRIALYLLIVKYFGAQFLRISPQESQMLHLLTATYKRTISS